MAVKKATKKKAPAKQVAAKQAVKKKAVKKVVKQPAAGVSTVVPPPPKLPVGKGPIGYTTSNVFKLPLAKVWDAVVLSKHMKQHFVDDMKGEYGPKLQPISWFWKEWGWVTFKVVKFEKHKEIVMHMGGWGEKYLTVVRFEFVRKDGKTIFRVHESGYPTKHLKNAFMMCEGWTEFHCGVKAYLLYGKALNRD
ncbi:SRPBCC domain-containing protein [candidate division KSB1 bacterium]|nr:SRPBCC domain-containing protein [candidate division KSB1 bacterium]